MPTYTGHPEADAEIEQLVRKNLFRIDRFMTSMGFPPMSKEELGSIYQFASGQARRVAQQVQAKQSGAAPGNTATPLLASADRIQPLPPLKPFSQQKFSMISQGRRE